MGNILKISKNKQKKNCNFIDFAQTKLIKKVEKKTIAN
jgi:hypothetical protein